eukprot:4577579-Pleurochrysis_carterae.AAC.1
MPLLSKRDLKVIGHVACGTGDEWLRLAVLEFGHSAYCGLCACAAQRRARRLRRHARMPWRQTSNAPPYLVVIRTCVPVGTGRTFRLSRTHLLEGRRVQHSRTTTVPLGLLHSYESTCIVYCMFCNEARLSQQLHDQRRYSSTSMLASQHEGMSAAAPRCAGWKWRQSLARVAPSARRFVRDSVWRQAKDAVRRRVVSGPCAGGERHLARGTRGDQRRAEQPAAIDGAQRNWRRATARSAAGDERQPAR